jgi:hypothetical protein
VPLPTLMAELVRRVGGTRSQRARAVRASDLDGVLVLILAPAALAALGPVRSYGAGHR